MPKNQLGEYIRVMNCIDIDDSVKQQIIKNCARYSTMKRIRSLKFRITAIKKDKSTDNL